MLQKADTIGVFQVESRAQMATLPRLKPTHFYDLVVEVAIIRPGPIVGDMVHPYLNRRAGREPVVPLHPCLEPVLARTLGVPLFQEQLLRMAMVAAGFSGGQAEELRRAMGFKRSEKRMKQIEVQLRDGMAKNGIAGATAERIIQSITSFALYGFPESHAASFALLAYASAYLKVHYPGAFYTALLNNQPMGFYHPASLVKDAQRRGVRFHPIDVQQSDWLCRVEEDGAIRLGFMYVTGLRKEVGQAMAAFDRTKTMAPPPLCAKCGCDDESMIEAVDDGYRPPAAGSRRYYCNICSHDWTVQLQPAGRFDSIEQLVQRTGLRRDELTTLADIGALNAFTNERRSALWQIERAVRPAGALFAATEDDDLRGGQRPPRLPEADSPLRPMDAQERLHADYAGTGLTIGPHPMALRREELALRGIVRASDLPRTRDGRRVRVAGMVITRFQRHHPPGPVRPRAHDRRPPAVPRRGRRAAEPGRRSVGAGGAARGDRRRRIRGRARFLLAEGHDDEFRQPAHRQDRPRDRREPRYRARRRARARGIGRDRLRHRAQHRRSRPAPVGHPHPVRSHGRHAGGDAVRSDRG
jgi:error-prone DNA polymerase